MRKDGTRFWASVIIDAIKDHHGKLVGFAKVTRDMTEKRETQLRLDESREQLFRSQKMEALGQLTGGLAHDFNNLLTAILGAADLASRNLDDKERLKRMIEGIRNSAQRGANLTRQLLAFARAQPLEIKQINLRQFLGDITTLIRPSLRSDIEVVIEMSDQLWNVDADATALELSLLNLAFNSRDAMSGGGTLKFSASNQVLTGEPDGLHGEHVALKVTDSGTGMDEVTMERVFEPFFTTKAYGEGTGLGLSQVFGFAKQIGGGITVEFRAGQRLDLHTLSAGQPGDRSNPGQGQRNADNRPSAGGRGRRAGRRARRRDAQRTGLRAQRGPQRQRGARAAHRRRPAQAYLLGYRHARRDQRDRARAESPRAVSPSCRSCSPPATARKSAAPTAFRSCKSRMSLSRSPERCKRCSSGRCERTSPLSTDEEAVCRLR